MFNSLRRFQIKSPNRAINKPVMWGGRLSLSTTMNGVSGFKTTQNNKSGTIGFQFPIPAAQTNLNLLEK